MKCVTTGVAGIAAGLCVFLGLPGAAGCAVPPIWLPNFADWPVNLAGYELETLPVSLAASYARGSRVYLGLADGGIHRADDDLSLPWTDLRSPLTEGPRMIFASKAGAVFASANGKPIWRTADNGETWSVCLDVPVWRMDEDDSGALYAGNYTQDNEHIATLYKSTDDGATWSVIRQDGRNRHIHTVRWDDRAKRLYIAYGDASASRGQAYSDDRGATFHVLAEGRGQGHTDVAVLRDYVLWASDDQSGRVIRVSRQSGLAEELMGWSQFMWFAVADDEQVFVGTMTSRKEGGERAALLASSDQGATWQKLLETSPSRGPYGEGFAAESRELSAGGWLYVAGGGQSYRVRKVPG